jgi:DNA-directed RNA polymerase specialized sigma24 family protein
MVWKSFLQHDQTRFTDWDEKRLRGYLEQVLDNKLKEIHRRYLSYQIRNVRRNETGTEEILKNHPVPEELPQLRLTDTDNWRRMCAALTPIERRVLLLRIQGLKLNQISDDLELHRRSVQKIMRRVRRKFVETSED